MMQNGSELTLPFCMDYSSSTPRKLRVAGKEDFLQHKKFGNPSSRSPLSAWRV
jgi:hypothetical protein